MMRNIELTNIVPNPMQPRKDFDQALLWDLARSIKENGLAQPITVRPADDGQYMIVMGERRFRAHKLLKSGTILAHVRSLDDDQMAVNAIIENLQRVDIKPMEAARAYQMMIDRGHSVEKVAKMLGVKPHKVEEKLKLLTLDETLQSLIDSGNMGEMAGWELSRLDVNDQIKIARSINAGKLKSLNEIRGAIDLIIDKKNQGDIFGGKAPKADAAEIETINRMERKIAVVESLVINGFKDGECVVARKVSPDRTRLMADKLHAINLSLTRMERQLRKAAAQNEMVMEDAE